MIRIYFPFLYLCIVLMSNCNGDKVMEEVLAAVEKAIAFYWDSYTDMNIDGIFGLRVIEGQIQLMLDFLRSKSPLEGGLQEVYVRLDEAHRQAKDISESSLKVLKEMDEQYFEVMNGLIRRPWTFARNYRRIDPTLKWKNSSTLIGGMNETFSDQCMNELLGGPTQTPCSISKECVTAMSRRGMERYGITHQLLYTMLAEQSGCLGILNRELSRLPTQLTVEKLQEEFCTNNFFETSRSVIVQNNIIKFPFKDLFLEQEVVCTMLGYVEFLHNDWLQQILSWQMPSGCYGENDLIKEGHSRRVQRESKTVSNNGVDFEQPTRVNHLAQPYEHRSVRPTLQGKPESIGEHNHEQGRVGDTQMRMKENMSNQGFRRVGNIWKRLIPVTETGGGDNHSQIALDEDNFRINRKINRKLLVEKSLNDGCLAHTTAVAVGALSQYLRFLIFANSSGFDATKHLFGINYLTHPDSLLPSFVPTSSGLIKKILILKSEADAYDEDDVNDVAMGTERPIVKSHEDDLLLYNELGIAKPEVVTAVTEVVNRLMVRASHMHSSGDSSFEALSSISSTFVIVITAVILLVLYRSLRKHRIGIQHRHGRWK